MFVKGVGSHDPFNRWHRVKRTDEHALTTACDLYMMCVVTAERVNDIPLSDDLCTSDACGMRRAISQALNKCAVENRQSTWDVTY